MPSGSALVLMTLMVCGWRYLSKITVFLLLVSLNDMVIASAAAVDSSSIDAFAIGNEVISDIIV